eukprot:scaffold74044_cov32-Tisochrysis_lutea.AAC.3
MNVGTDGARASPMAVSPSAAGLPGPTSISESPSTSSPSLVPVAVSSSAKSARGCTSLSCSFTKMSSSRALKLPTHNTKSKRFPAPTLLSSSSSSSSSRYSPPSNASSLVN